MCMINLSSLLLGIPFFSFSWSPQKSPWRTIWTGSSFISLSFIVERFMISPVTLNARRRVIKALKKAKKQSRKHRHQQMHWTNGSAEKTWKDCKKNQGEKSRYCFSFSSILCRIPASILINHVYLGIKTKALVFCLLGHGIVCSVLLRVSTKYTSAFSLLLLSCTIHKSQSISLWQLPFMTWQTVELPMSHYCNQRQSSERRNFA